MFCNEGLGPWRGLLKLLNNHHLARLVQRETLPNHCNLLGLLLGEYLLEVLELLRRVLELLGEYLLKLLLEVMHQTTILCLQPLLC